VTIHNRNRKSLNKDSQIRDLPLLPLSNSDDTQEPNRLGVDALKLNLGLDVQGERLTNAFRLASDQQQLRRADALRISVRGIACAIHSLRLTRNPLRR